MAWQREQHRWNWTAIKRWLRRPDGSWKPIAAADVVLFDPTKVRIERYRYRGARIPSPYDPITAAERLHPRGEPVAVKAARRVRRAACGNRTGATRHCAAGRPNTLYFETDAGDGFREPGFSKERRLEPQITVGLLTDARGFPLMVEAFEGNRPRRPRCCR